MLRDNIFKIYSAVSNTVMMLALETINVFKIFFAVPKCFKYHQNACFRDN